MVIPFGRQRTLVSGPVKPAQPDLTVALKISQLRQLSPEEADHVEEFLDFRIERQLEKREAAERL